ncbi:hypothetical protein EJB05_18481 [Eragrostis curvula]|uniref:Uncharacterized protein n=1 Tax=Eragrostis curvula TaxID=38414 RepID=A0A5J9VM69_9POAL|nr:hypothetical protein EJB05_18481 [Eragrostis curvula]
MAAGRRRRWREGRVAFHQGAPAQQGTEEDDDERPVAKRRKICPLQIGRSCNVNQRHSMQFDCLLALITGRPKRTNLSANQELALHSDCSTGIYFERCDTSEANYIWMSSLSTNISIKLELLAAFGTDVMNSEERKPLLAFSEGFDDGAGWAATKSVLHEIFDASDPATQPDYLYSFTRVNEKFHLEVYKVLNWSLEDNAPSELLKPTKSFHPVLVSVNDMSSGSLIPHVLHQKNPKTLLLPPPPDSVEWEGFNTTADEFFDRYHAFKRTRIIGTGAARDNSVTPVPVNDHYHLCDPFKFFGRSLISRLEEVFAKNACYEKLKITNVFLKRKELKFLDVKLVPYSDTKAEENVRDVGHMIEGMLVRLGLLSENFPKDLQHCLKLLLVGSPGHQKVDIEDLLFAKNHHCWMPSLGKIHMIDDLFDEFTTKMSPQAKIRACAGFPSFHGLTLRVDRNWLMKECFDHYMPTDQKKAENRREAAKNALLEDVNFNRHSAVRLYAVDRGFRTIRNGFHHLQDHAYRLFGEVSREEVELVVSSEHCDMYTHVQQGMTREYLQKIKNSVYPPRAIDKEKASFNRFAKYFPEIVAFKEDDLKRGEQ